MANMKIAYTTSQVAAMKDEFFWKVFANTNARKRFFATIDIQGNTVYDHEDKSKKHEIKGVSLITHKA